MPCFESYIARSEHLFSSSAIKIPYLLWYKITKHRGKLHKTSFPYYSSIVSETDTEYTTCLYGCQGYNQSNVEHALTVE